MTNSIADRVGLASKAADLTQQAEVTDQCCVFAGQCIIHRKYRYRGVIAGFTHKCEASDYWCKVRPDPCKVLSLARLLVHSLRWRAVAQALLVSGSNLQLPWLVVSEVQCFTLCTSLSLQRCTVPQSFGHCQREVHESLPSLCLACEWCLLNRSKTEEVDLALVRLCNLGSLLFLEFRCPLLLPGTQKLDCCASCACR